MKKFLYGVGATLLVGGGLVIANNLLADAIYIILHFGKFALRFFIICWLVDFIIDNFGLTTWFMDQIEYFNKKSQWVWVSGLVVFIGGFIGMILYNQRFSFLEREFATYISDHIEFKQGSIPTIYIGDHKKN